MDKEKIMNSVDGRKYLVSLEKGLEYAKNELVFDREKYCFPEYKEKGIDGQVGNITGWGSDTGRAFIDLIDGDTSISDLYYKIIKEVIE